MSDQPVIVWFERDLRVADHTALAEAAATGQPVVPFLVWPEENDDETSPGEAARWWLARSATQLDAALGELGSRLIVREDDPAEALRRLVGEVSAAAVFSHRPHEPSAVARNARLRSEFSAAGVAFHDCPGRLLHDPHRLLTTAGTPYRVFTPFWRALRSAIPDPPATLAAPDRLRCPESWPKGLTVATLGRRACHRPAYDKAWRPGSASAESIADDFVGGRLPAYDAKRDCVGKPGTARLSPHLAFGEIGIRTVWSMVATVAHRSKQAAPSAEAFLRQLAWREFAAYLLVHYPATVRAPFRSAFSAFPYSDDPDAVAIWAAGRTGYPLVDAGMRELATTGWIHNRARLVAASFLTKHLLIDWSHGAQHFWNALVDADLANNTLGWQWCAGCGADAAPYFRIFNPTAQGERFDSDGTYTRRWVPELATLPRRWLHRPWQAPTEVQQASACRIGEDYPRPMVDHATARHRALAAYATLRKQSSIV